MNQLAGKLQGLAARVEAGKTIRIAIFGLGSVGHYLLEYLLELRDPQIKIFVVGRSREKLERDVNISRTARLIRGEISNEIEIVEADFNSIDSLQRAVAHIRPDFLINSSRAYSGLKYGSISWKAIRAYGLWAPLSVKYIRNIMQACAATSFLPAIVINTSYSDATNAWLKTAGLPHPDFGSGNLNHLVPRIRMAVASLLNVGTHALPEIDVTLATSHFHDVVISKEGVPDGLDPLLHLSYKGQPLQLDVAEIYRRCAIIMPVDQKRNMMNASSNFEIIHKLLIAIRSRSPQKIHVPGLDGMIGGYPLLVCPSPAPAMGFSCDVPTSPFSLEQMKAHNRQSIYLDGIADVRDGTLHYTPELLKKVKNAFGVDLPCEVSLAASAAVASTLVDRIIAKGA